MNSAKSYNQVEDWALAKFQFCNQWLQILLLDLHIAGKLDSVRNEWASQRNVGNTYSMHFVSIC